MERNLKPFTSALEILYGWADNHLIDFHLDRLLDCVSDCSRDRGGGQIAQVYAFRNQSEEAFAWLDRAYAQRDGGLIGTKVDPLLKSLHKDPRYAAFLKKLNLPN